MDDTAMRVIAAEVAHEALRHMDYLSVVEHLDEADIGWTEDESQKIHDMVARAEVVIR